MKLSQFKLTEKRREFLEKKLKIKFAQIKKAHIEDEKNIYGENLIGETTLPLGIAGPVKVKGFNLKTKEHYIPLSTTEGALIASINRGCKAINQSGAATVYIQEIGATRGPVYETKNLKTGFWFIDWLKQNEKEIKVVAERTSSHLQYLKFEAKVIGPYTYVRFYFKTGEAMGMNMVTFATESINQLIKKKTGINCLALSGNFCLDKKPGWLNFLSGRGMSLWAETIIKKELAQKILKTDAEKIYEVWLAKNMMGSALSGSSGFNAHFTNIVAAFFAATGQDLAHIVEGSLGVTATKILTNGDLYFSIHLPALMLGMIGGGTKLEVKKEAIALTGAKNKEELAEVLGAAILAGELSLLASLAQGSLAKAHQRLGRR